MESGRQCELVCFEHERRWPTHQGRQYGVAGIVVGTTMSLTTSATVDAQGGTTAGKLELKGNGAEWSSSSCKLDATGVQMGVAAGRYWATFACMGATSGTGETCDIFGQLRIENCTATF